MKLKKIAYYALLLLLAAGASLIIGLLSFSGMFALWPILGLACTVFVLSVAYEGQIYLENLWGALTKLFQPNYLKHYYADDYLQTCFPDTLDEDCPQFFKDYDLQLSLLHNYEHKRLDRESRAGKKQLEQTLRDMEKWFATQLFTQKRTPTAFETTILNPLLKNRSIHSVAKLEATATKYKDCFVYCEATHKLYEYSAKGTSSLIQKDNAFMQNLRAILYEIKLQKWLSKDQARYQSQLAGRTRTFRFVQIGSFIASIFMGFGTTYLLVEAFTVIPFLAVLPLTLWPILIVPMAAIAGSAYGLLTYNAITDMIANDTMRNWYIKLRDNLRQGFTLRNVLMTIAAIALVTLTLALTICTAGTWWTVVKQTRPLFTWMGKMPWFIMQVINPIVIGITTLFFNLENTFETLTLIDDATQKTNPFVSFFSGWGAWMQNAYTKLRQRENFWQILNPFRIILKLTITPLRILLFLGHLISIGVTSDRLPGVPEILSAILGIISEGFEDAHYFFGHDKEDHKCGSAADRRNAHFNKEHGHNHDDDIPTRLLKALFYPVYWLAAVWDFQMSKLNAKDTTTPKRPVWDNLKSALDKQMGLPPKQTVNLSPKALSPSLDWKKQHIVYLLDKRKAQLDSAQIGSNVAKEKSANLEELKADVYSMDLKTPDALEQRLKPEIQKPVYQTHRAPTLFTSNTATTDYLIQLPERTKNHTRPQSPTSIAEMFLDEDDDDDDAISAPDQCGANCTHKESKWVQPESFGFCPVNKKKSVKKPKPPIENPINQPTIM